MRFLVPVLLLMVIVSVGCSNDTMPEEAITTTTTQLATTTTSTTTTTIAPPKAEMSAELKNILSRSDKVTSYQYLLREEGKLVTYYVKDTKMRADFQGRQFYNDFLYYKIYISGDTAVLVCDDWDECRGLKGYRVDSAGFMPYTPLEVLEHIDNGVITEHVQLENKAAAVVVYTNPDNNVERVWLWEYWGMPMQREISQSGKKVTIEYDNLVINTVKDLDVTVPSNIEVV